MSPHFVSQEAFAESLIRFVASLTAEQKAEIRTAMYRWADERAKKPAEN